MKKAFTMVELVFVIVIVALLATVAIPKFSATRDDAVISKGRAAVAAIRSAIAMERQKRILRGNFDDITGGEVEELLDYKLSDRWNQSGDTFTFTAPSGQTCSFDVDHNKFKLTSCEIDGMKDL